MAESTTTTETTETTTTPPATGDESQLGDAGKAALTAERRAKAAAEREAATLRAKVEELENAGRSEAEKAVARAEKAEREAAELRTSIEKREVAEAAGLPAAMAGRLQGTTRAELEADAVELAKLVPATPGESTESTTPAGDKPTENLRNGGNPSGDIPLNGDPIVAALSKKLGIPSS